MSCAKVVELIGCSNKSFDDATNEAFNRAKKTIRGITGMKVVGQSVKIENNKIKEYRVNLKLSFGVE
ncbi:dodecin domain-containing protein [Candidatus Woesearchaeota archaeon]|nr:dodecin domain-containing protein [Candidatus Woesearchaeota archaeon]